MATSGSFANTTDVSATFHPTDGVSEYSIYGTFTGTIRLQHSSPGNARWIDADVIVSQQSSGITTRAAVIDTPDILRDYRFVGTGIVGTAYYYFGA